MQKKGVVCIHIHISHSAHTNTGMVFYILVVGENRLGVFQSSLSSGGTENENEGTEQNRKRVEKPNVYNGGEGAHERKGCGGVWRRRWRKSHTK
jgi:hypothetical protein